jgi:hypothetical protein
MIFKSQENTTTVHAIYLHKNILVKVALAAMKVPNFHFLLC